MLFLQKHIRSGVICVINIVSWGQCTVHLTQLSSAPTTLCWRLCAAIHASDHVAAAALHSHFSHVVQSSAERAVHAHPDNKIARERIRDMLHMQSG